MVPEDLLADLRWRSAGALCQIGQMAVGGICEIQVPLAFQLAVLAVLRAHSIWSTECSLDRLRRSVNLIWLLRAEKILKPVQWICSGLGATCSGAARGGDEPFVGAGEFGVVGSGAVDGEEGAADAIEKDGYDWLFNAVGVVRVVPKPLGVGLEVDEVALAAVGGEHLAAAVVLADQTGVAAVRCLKDLDLGEVLVFPARCFRGDCYRDRRGATTELHERQAGDAIYRHLWWFCKPFDATDGAYAVFAYPLARSALTQQIQELVFGLGPAEVSCESADRRKFGGELVGGPGFASLDNGADAVETGDVAGRVVLTQDAVELDDQVEVFVAEELADHGSPAIGHLVDLAVGEPALVEVDVLGFALAAKDLDPPAEGGGLAVLGDHEWVGVQVATGRAWNKPLLGAISMQVVVQTFYCDERPRAWAVERAVA